MVCCGSVLSQEEWKPLDCLRGERTLGKPPHWRFRQSAADRAYKGKKIIIII